MRASADAGQEPVTLSPEGEFVAIRLPVADAARIDVDEVRLRVDADAADLHGDRSIMQLLQRYVGEADVDRHAVHVQAVQNDAVALGGKRRVGPRAAIAGGGRE